MVVHLKKTNSFISSIIKACCLAWLAQSQKGIWVRGMSDYLGQPVLFRIGEMVWRVISIADCIAITVKEVAN